MDNLQGTHVEDGALLALLDGELDAAERDAFEAHLSDCSECSERHDELRFLTKRVASELALLDVPSPWTELPEHLRQASREAVRPISSAGSARTARAGWVGRRSVATAAGLLLVLAAGAYAIPGSPVRGFVDDALSAVASLVGIGDEAPVDPGPAGVSVGLRDGAVRVVIFGATPELRVTVFLTSGDQAVATARDPRFRVEAGLLEISDPTDELQIAVPRDAQSATVEVDGAVVARFENGQLRRTPAADDVPAEIFVRTGG